MKTTRSIEQATDAQLRDLALRMQLPNELWMICQSALPLLTAERRKLQNFLTTNHVVGFVA